MPGALGVLSAMASCYGFDSHQVQIALRSAAPAKVLAAAALGEMRCWAVLRLLWGASDASKRVAELFRTAQWAVRANYGKRLNSCPRLRERPFFGVRHYLRVGRPLRVLNLCRVAVTAPRAVT